MKTLLVAAGTSVAYEDASFYYPKNLVEVGGSPLIAHVIAGLGDLARESRLIAIVPRDEVLRFHTDRVVTLVEPTAVVVEVGETSGAACSALLAAEYFDDDEPLVVANGDQVIDANLSAVVNEFDSRGLDAGVVVFDAVHPRWSYVRLEGEMVVEASEKRPISRLATAGFFWFRHGRDFVASTMSMIRKDAHVDGRFFVCPSLNELVLSGGRIGVHHVPRSHYFSLHEPAGLAPFEQHLSACAI